MTQEIKPAYATFEQYESYCDLKLLQLLYDKGFRFKLETEGHRVINNLAEQRFNEGHVSYCNNYITYSVVVEWLRVNHGIWVYSYNNGTSWIGSIQKTNGSIIRIIPANDTPQEAYSAAFDYILNNLI
jgi:hypothetical protein